MSSNPIEIDSLRKQLLPDPTLCRGLNVSKLPKSALANKAPDPGLTAALMERIGQALGALLRALRRNFA
jgi:hypothetical protein